MSMPGRAKISPMLNQDGTVLVEDYKSSSLSMLLPPSLPLSLCFSRLIKKWIKWVGGVIQMGHTALFVFCTISSDACEALCVCGCGLVIKEVQAKTELFPSHSFVVLVHSEV